MSVIRFGGTTRGLIPVAQVLGAAIGQVLGAAIGKVEEVIVLGVTPDDEYYFASASGDKCEMLFLVEKFKQELLRGDE